MNITRHNYEEYFILYMDNELSSDQRRMVENFVQTNADLKDELDTLLQYKLEPDTAITYSGKEGLLKPFTNTGNTRADISLNNYEEWLVLYNDNELSPVYRLQVESFLAVNPVFQKELLLLQKSKLQPETAIVFANKEILYRKEEKVRAMPPRWWRYAAAAVLLLAAGLTAVTIINNNKSSNEEIVLAKGGEKKIAPTPSIAPSSNPLDVTKEDSSPVFTTGVQDNIIKKQPGAESKLAANPISPKNKTQLQGEQQTFIAPASIKKNEPVVAENDQNKPSNNLPTPIKNPNVNNIQKNAMANADVPVEIKNSPNPLTNSVVTIANTPPSDIKHASVKENVIDPDAALADGGKKNKLRGFFRKVTRTFEKRTNIDATNGDDRLLVAGLSFKLR